MDITLQTLCIFEIVSMIKKPTRNKKLIRQIMLLTNPRGRRSYFQLIKVWNPVWQKERSEILLQTLLIFDLRYFLLTKNGDCIDFDILTNCSLTCTCGSHAFFVYMTYWAVDPLRSVEGRKQKWHLCF